MIQISLNNPQNNTIILTASNAWLSRISISPLTWEMTIKCPTDGCFISISGKMKDKTIQRLDTIDILDLLNDDNKEK